MKGLRVHSEETVGILMRLADAGRNLIKKSLLVNIGAGLLMAYYFALGPWYSRGDKQDVVQKKTYELLKNNKERAPINLWVYLVDLGKPVIVIVWDEYKMNEVDAMGGPYKIFRSWVTDSGGQSFDDADLVFLNPDPLELPGNYHLEMLLGFRGVIDKFWASRKQSS